MLVQEENHANLIRMKLSKVVTEANPAFDKELQNTTIGWNPAPVEVSYETLEKMVYWPYQISTAAPFLPSTVVDLVDLGGS